MHYSKRVMTCICQYVVCGIFYLLYYIETSGYYLDGDCLLTGKLSRYITNVKVNSAFHPSGVGKSSTGLFD